MAKPVTIEEWATNELMEYMHWSEEAWEDWSEEEAYFTRVFQSLMVTIYPNWPTAYLGGE